MRAIVIIFFPQCEVHRETKALTMTSAKVTKVNAPHLFWTWFIENPPLARTSERTA